MNANDLKNKCPRCKAELSGPEVVSLFSSWRGSRPKPPNPKSAENGRKGGRPKGSKNKIKAGVK